MGQLRQLEAGAAHDLGETPSRSAICWVLGRWTCPCKEESMFLLSAQSEWACLSAEGCEEGCVKVERAGFTQPDCHWNEK